MKRQRFAENTHQPVTPHPQLHHHSGSKGKILKTREAEAESSPSVRAQLSVKEAPVSGRRKFSSAERKRASL
jgi:hypothetical protein